MTVLYFLDNLKAIRLLNTDFFFSSSNYVIKLYKASRIQEAISDAGHILEFLPPYSPQLNPIEHKWAQAKAIRKQKHSSITQLFSLYTF